MGFGRPPAGSAAARPVRSNRDGSIRSRRSARAPQPRRRLSDRFAGVKEPGRVRKGVRGVLMRVPIGQRWVRGVRTVRQRVRGALREGAGGADRAAEGVRAVRQRVRGARAKGAGGADRAAEGAGSAGDAGGAAEGAAGAGRAVSVLVAAGAGTAVSAGVLNDWMNCSNSAVRALRWARASSMLCLRRSSSSSAARSSNGGRSSARFSIAVVDPLAAITSTPSYARPGGARHAMIDELMNRRT